MIIGFDAKRAAQNGTGLGNYSRFIIGLLAKYAPETQLKLYVPNPRKATLLNRLPKVQNITTIFPQKKRERLFRSLWRTFGITNRLEKDNVTIFHGLSNELPLNIRKAHHVKSVVTIHDILYLRFPQGYKWIDRVLYNFKYRRACLNADHIIAVSQFTKEEIMRWYGIQPNRISVVYQGCDESFRHRCTEEKLNSVRQHFQLPKRYILYVGSIERRKNLILLAKALSSVEGDIEVIAAGKRTPYADEVEQFLKENGLSHRMHLHSDIPFADFPALYQMAEVFVYPSHCEGFGIPMLEALCSGVPAIGCTGSCLEEAGGPDSAYVNPEDAEALAAEINDILSNPARRDRMIEQGLKYAEQFTEDKLFNHLMSFYQNLEENK